MQKEQVSYSLCPVPLWKQQRMSCLCYDLALAFIGSPGTEFLCSPIFRYKKSCTVKAIEYVLLFGSSSPHISGTFYSSNCKSGTIVYF